MSCVNCGDALGSNWNCTVCGREIRKQHDALRARGRELAQASDELTRLDEALTAEKAARARAEECTVDKTNIVQLRDEIADRDKRILVEEELHARAIGRAEKVEAERDVLTMAIRDIEHYHACNRGGPEALWCVCGYCATRRQKEKSK